MDTQEAIVYQRIENAIHYLLTHFKLQPNLEQVAAHVHLSPFHFQRLFTEWAGVSPKKFLQFITIEHAKKLLKDPKVTLFDTAIETGLSGTGRLHDLFVTIEGMTPGEFKNGGAALLIQYSHFPSPFGQILIASTDKGICYMAFEDDENTAFGELTSQFPNAKLTKQRDLLQQNALTFFTQNEDQNIKIKLHIKGTDFQIKAWEALLKIPSGRVATYQQIAHQISHPKASRAVGSAIAANPIAFLIPCHRVIQSSGHFGNYHWGSVRKTAMIGWESAMIEKN